MGKLDSTGIYKIQNNITKDFYIGSAVNFQGRFSVHLSQLRNNKHPNIHLQRAWNKFSENNFNLFPIIYCDRSNLLLYEQMFLDCLSPRYNISTKATGGSGVVTQKMRDAARRNGLAQKGKPKPESYSKKLSKRMMGNKLGLGKEMSDENKEKLSRRNLGNTYFSGKKHTDEWKELMSKKLKGRKFSEETKKKMSESAKSSKRMANNNLFGGHTHSDESKKKISETLKARYAKERAEKEGRQC